MENMRLRALAPDEHGVAEDIMRSAIKGRCSSFYGEHTVRKWTSLENDKFKFQIPQHAFCAANDDGPVSIAGWTNKPTADGADNGAGAARISAVFTHPDYAGNGIGEQLMRLVEDDIRKAGYSHILLFATMNAVPFYRKNGFEDRGEQLLEVAQGHFISICRMVKSIAQEEVEMKLKYI